MEYARRLKEEKGRTGTSPFNKAARHERAECGDRGGFH